MDTLYHHTENEPHHEEHFTGNETVRDVVIGMSDGLTVPFALAAGISGAVAATSLVVTAGLAEIAAGSIAMGLGGYLAARSEEEHYRSELRREEREIVEKPDAERAEVRELLEQYGLTPDESGIVMTGLERRPEAWRDFMMRFELGLEEPDPKRALRSAVTIAGAYIAGGFVPLAPYMIYTNDATRALTISIVVTLIALGAFGWMKGRFTGVSPFKSGLQTMTIGGIAAGAAFGIAKLIERA
jgi:VIT1/CCC1 family predicted Fe2+/Mn2+ transporter